MPENPAYAPIAADPKLPDVLLIGDSISIGYTLPVRRLLSGRANVHRPAENCGPTILGLKRIDAWLGETRWDVIHFNFGLHDLKYANEQGELVAVDAGRQQVPEAEYVRNLEVLVGRMARTGAKLIWASTTPIPEGARGRIPGDEQRYNAAAAGLMRAHGIPTDDLYACAGAGPKLQLPADVHFRPEGYEALAEQVAAAITAALGGGV